MWNKEDSFEELPWIDFSKVSRVREALKQSLLARRNEELSLDVLDLVTAAGTAYRVKDNK